MKTLKAAQFIRLFTPLMLVLVMVLASFGSANASGIPILSIKSVEVDKSVTVHGYNFPVGQSFTVKMGAYGTYALGGTKVGNVEIAADGAFDRSFDIPEALKGLARIAIRMDSAQGYYSYNWFYNDPDAKEPVPPIPGYTGYPTFNISGVDKNTSVSLVTYNLPPNQVFTVRMGEFGELGLDGIVVGTLDSGKGGSHTLSFDIPAALKDRARIAIRMDSPAGFYAFNWFYNNTAEVVTPGPDPDYSGIPTIKITAVVKGTSVSIAGDNFPAGQTFTVKMGEFGTLGIGGIVVGSYDSGSGEDFTKTFTIPAALAGKNQVAIRLETASGYFYAFNWFYNNTTN